MDLSSDKTPAVGINGPIELIVAYGHRLKLHRVNSKDKLNNAFVTNANDQEKKRSVSRLPRVKKAPLGTKTPLYPNKDKNVIKNFVPLDNSGDSLAGPSNPTKPKSLPPRTRRPSPRYEGDRLKPSQIPKRKTGISSPAPKYNDRKPDNNYFVNDTQHIQRLQVPNVPDFHHEDQIPTTSIGSTRPIPTLGQIYRHNNIIIDGDRFYDWFMELDTPVNSLESNPRNIQRTSTDSTDTAQSVINVEVNKAYFGETEKPKVVFGANVYKTTNDNISDWLSTDLEYSSRDNESGYRSMSPHSRGAINVESKYSNQNVKQSDENYCLGLAKTSEDSEPNEREGASNENNIGEQFQKAAFEPSETTVKDMPLVEQSTVIISRVSEENETESVQTEKSVNKADKGMEPIVICKSELSKNLQFPSMTESDSKDEKQAFAPSYVECPSEILQRTTNFEGDGLESPKTLSSLACTDLEIRDDYSSQYTLENVDDCNLLEDHGSGAWCPGCRSQSCMTFIKSDESGNTTLQNSICGCRGDKTNGTKVVDSDNHVHRDKRKYCRLCGRRNSPTRRGDIRKYCKKHSRYRRFPSYRYKITRPFDTLRKRLSITRICRHRWNHVWKKTAARWANWAKSPSKLGRFQMLEYLQSSIIWEDVDVQTLTLVYRETGTHTNVMQQKSAGISASIKQSTSAKKTDTGGVGTSARSFKSRFKHMNLGPSRFPFFYNSKRKSMPLKKMEEPSKTVHRFYSYPINQNTDEATRSRRNSKIHCLCEDELQTTNANTSPINFHKLKTVEHNILGTKEVTIINPMDNKITSTPRFTSSAFKPRDACTQVVLTYNNIETDISFAPIFENHSVGNVSGDIAFYKPCGINTDSMKIETNQVAKQSVQLMTSKGAFSDTSKIAPAASKPSPMKKVSVKISTSGHTLDERTKTDLSTETAPPCLMCTEAKIVSISSAQMLPVAVLTSHTDLPPTGARNPVSTTSCQYNNNPSVTCRCNDSNVVSTAQFQVCTSTASPGFATEDRSFGPSLNSKKSVYEKNTSTYKNDTVSDIKQTRNLSTQALINQWCQSQMFVDTGTTPVALDKKSTYVFTSVGQKSAYAVTSVNNQSNYLVKKSGNCILQRASVATNTSFSVGKRSFGQSLQHVFSNKSLQKPTIDTWVQYSHIQEQSGKHSLRSARIGHSKLISSQPLDKSSVCSRAMTHLPCFDNETEPIFLPALPHNSMAVMTSGPFDEASDTTGLKGDRYGLLCGCAQVGCDIETNTVSNLKITQNRECSTQIFQSQCNQNLDKCSSYGEQSKTGNTSTFNQRSTAEQLTTLSRLIGHPPSSQIHSDASTILSSNLDAAKWIKRCTHEDKEYQSILDKNQSNLETLKQASLSIANSSKSTKSTKKPMKIESKSKPSLLCSLNTVVVAAPPPPPPPPIGTLSDDSLADVLPISSVTRKISLLNESKKMSDKYTSDEVISKELKESILQTCPDICDAATDTMVLAADYLKSTSALTSKCVLPSPSICSQSNENSECVFVYDKPHCAIHKQRIDASVQMSVKHCYGKSDKDPKSREHAIDQLECDAFESRPSSFKQKPASKSIIAEVLSPKVYKALYETTKMVVKDSKLRSVGDTGAECVPEIDNEAALIRALAIRSAAILTSRCGMCPSDNCNCNLKADPTVKRTEYVFAYDTPHPSLEDSTQTCSNCHARVLEIPPYFESDFVGERLQTQLVGSCRYYSNMLTKRLGRVKEKVTKRLAPPAEQCLYFSTVPKLSYTEACTMKPSGREDLGCQTIKNHETSHYKPAFSRPMSCCALSPSLTNICGGTDKNHLKSVYYMLSAIEGRIRRLKRNIPN